MIRRDLWLHLCQARQGHQHGAGQPLPAGDRGLVTGRPETECSQKMSLPNIPPPQPAQICRVRLFAAMGKQNLISLAGEEPCAGGCGVPGGIQLLCSKGCCEEQDLWPEVALKIKALPNLLSNKRL